VPVGDKASYSLYHGRGPAIFHTFANHIAQSLTDLYGITVEMVSAAGLARCREIDAALPDALVLFGTTLARHFVSDTALQPLWQKALLVLDAATVPTIAETQTLGVARAILTTHPHTGRRFWTFPLLREKDLASDSAVFAFVQPLSLIMGDRHALADNA
jgi:hypothetical protein